MGVAIVQVRACGDKVSVAQYWAGDNSYVSIEQAAAEAVAVVQRARALFGFSAQSPAVGELTLESVAQAVDTAGARAAVLSGDLVDAHRGFVDGAIARLSSNGQSDARLHQTLGGAALLAQSGARRLDAIAVQTRALAQAASGARSPAAQRALLQGLRTEVSAEIGRASCRERV